MSNIDSSPEFRASVLAAIVNEIAAAPSSIRYLALEKSVRCAVGKREEESSSEIMAGVSLLIRAGMVECNRHDPESDCIYYGADTEVVAGKRMLQFAWSEDLYHHASDEGEAA